MRLRTPQASPVRSRRLAHHCVSLGVPDGRGHGAPPLLACSWRVRASAGWVAAMAGEAGSSPESPVMTTTTITTFGIDEPVMAWLPRPTPLSRWRAPGEMLPSPR